MLVSHLNGQYLYGINYEDRGATVFEITDEEYASISSGLSEIVNLEVVLKPIEPIVEPTEEEIEEQRLANLKQELITKMQEIQKEAIEKRSEYTTTRDMLPEGNPIREMKLQKLDYEGSLLLEEFESIGSELVENFGENILLEII